MAIYDIDSLPSSFKEGDIINCPYSGTIKSIALPKGKYKFELWGGSSLTSSSTNKGGYTVGDYTVTSTELLYLVCGGGSTSTGVGGYNGGGDNTASTFDLSGGNLPSFAGKFNSGAGATHVAFVSGLLPEIGESRISGILAVAGGSGGNGTSPHGQIPYLVPTAGGHGGGSTGCDGVSTCLGSSYDSYAKGGTQSAGGTAGVPYSQSEASFCGGKGSFGKGGAGCSYSFTYDIPTGAIATVSAGGGGGGLYGGGGGSTHQHTPEIGSNTRIFFGSGGGGSGYISDVLEDATTYNPGADIPECPDTSNGYIRITVLIADDTGVKNVKTKVEGTWEDCTPLVKVNNTWKDIDKLFVKANGYWEPVIYNVPPTPVVSTFKIGNITYTFEEGMTWNDWVLSSKYSKSTSGMNIPSSPTSAGFHGELSSSVEITDNSEAYKSGAGYVCVGWGDSNEEAYWDLLVYSPDIYSLIRKVRSWETISPNQEYFIKWA